MKFSDDTRASWNILAYVKGTEVRVNFGRAGEDACMDMRKEHFDILMGLQSAQSVTSRMLGMGYNEPKDLALVGQYFRKAITDRIEPLRMARPAAVKVHWPASFEAETEECSARAYSIPLVSDESLMPMIRRWECLSDSLERRVTLVRNEVEPPHRYERWAEEFVRLVVPIPDIGHPLSLEDAAAALSKPSQVLAVANIWDTVDMNHRRLIESFVKNEPTMKNGRIISSFADARFLLKFSTFTLPFRDRILHAEWNRHWFCPGLTPGEIALKVQEYVGSVFNPAEGDYANLDGTISLWLQRRVMNAVYHRYFHPDYRKELTTYTDMMVNCPARAKRFGFRYDAGVGVKSGSPTTCDLNTVANAFVMYCAIRMAFPELSPQEAYQLIGLAFGDDGLFDSAFTSAWNKVAKALGLTLKVENFKPENGVVFLARVFPDPWNTTTSFQDPLRTWRKLHLTMRDPTVPLPDAACDRLEGYLTTDRLTPITSEYASAMLRYYLPLASTQRGTRKDRNREVPYWLTQGGAWPQNPNDRSLILHCMSTRLEMPIEGLRGLQCRLAECLDPWAVPTIDRTELDVPYTNTIDREGGLSEDRVDLRTLERDKHVHHTRANRGNANPSSPNSGGHADGPKGRRRNGSTRPIRSGRICDVPRRDGETGRKGNSQFSEQAQGASIAAGGDCRDHRQRPSSQVERRGANSGNQQARWSHSPVTRRRRVS